MLSDTEVPRLYPHHVVKHELQVQAPFYTHLQKIRELELVHNRRETNRIYAGVGTCLHI